MSKTNTKQGSSKTPNAKIGGVANDAHDLKGAYKKNADNPLALAAEVARIIRKNPEEATLEVTGMLQQIAKLQQEITRLHQLSRTDSLTGLFNRHHITDDLSGYCSPHPGGENRQNMHGGTHILMIDLDKFKPINDNYGHIAGDEALKKVAAMLTHHTRKTDTVARLGGDEFLILLKGISDEDAQKKVQEIQNAFNSLSLVWGEKEIDLRGSVGHWKVDPHMTAEQNIHQADQQMYAQKKSRKVERGPQP